MNCNLLVVGAGGAGLAAAVTAAEGGASVIVLDRLRVTGGATVFAKGIFASEAVHAYGEENVLIGFALYEDTAKGIAMGADTCFAKVIADSSTGRILGAHIAGPSAAILIQEILTLMRVKKDTTVFDIGEAMHIHPALSEVIEHACLSLMPVSHYHHILQDHLGLGQGPGQMK